MRLFVGIFPDKDIAKALWKMGEKIRGEWKREPPEKLHITLKFMPDEDPERIGKLLEELRHPSFEVVFNKVGTFPPRGRPRVIWVGVEGEGLLSLKREVDRLIGIPDDKPFVPHLTLGRAKRWIDVDSFLREKVHIKWRVEKVSLVSSTLTPEGSVYKVIKEYELQD